jgi:phosphonate transport system substrate-binding protein
MNRRNEVKKRTSIMFVLISVLVLASMLLSACAQPTAAPATKEAPTTAAPAATKAPTVAPTVAPTAAAVAKPLGTGDNPIIMALAPSATADQLTVGGDAIAKQLNELTGYTFKVIIPNSYTALIEAMASGNAQIGWMPTFAYLLAKQKGAATVALVTVRNGSDFYGAQYIANVSSGFTPYFDPATNKNTADAATALKQFDGKRPCFTDPLSTSGYIIPGGLLSQYSVKYKTPAAVQGHPAVVSALYVGGICDFGATYVDARTSIQKTYPDVMDKIVVIWRTDNIIPNDNVSYSSTMPADVAAKLTQALLDMSSTDSGHEVLKNMGYDIEGLKVAEDSFYDPFRAALQASGIDITTMVK